MSRLAPTTLRWRLAGWVAAVTLICTGIAFAAVYRGTGSQLRSQVDHELQVYAGELSHDVTRTDAATPTQLSAAAKRYVLDQPFSAGSTLLFVTVPGVGTSSNRLELFAGPAPDNGETPAEQASEGRLSARLLTVKEGYSTLNLPDIGRFRVIRRTVRTPAGLHATVGVGEPLAAVVHGQEGVARAFILAGILALAGALVASYLIGSRVSRPLRRMAGVAARVDAGDLRPRIEQTEGQSEEVRVLADAFNHMLDRLTDAFAGQRAFVADASHELRTPLTVIRGQLEVLAKQANPSAEEVRRVQRLVQAEIARITRLVDDLLLLANTEGTEFLRPESIDLPAFVSELWDGVSLVADRRYELGAIPEGSLRADPDRLAQALRNLLGNAIEHTSEDHGLVRMAVERTASGHVRFLVEDDGPGIPPEERERVFDRFHRTDPARDRASGGAGLGLAIVRAIVGAHGGRVSASQSPEGGARLEIDLPGFTPSTRPAGTRRGGDRATGAIAGGGKVS
ncbi:MAG TPA: ATP-binding protein [Solirubrobacteraceae bacterium]|nr:ATP-binding protein [Solirubrobacteraceae bacterium]